MSATGVDEAKLQEFMGRMVGYMTGGAACFGIWLGDELGLYHALRRPGSAERSPTRRVATRDWSASGSTARSRPASSTSTRRRYVLDLSEATRPWPTTRRRCSSRAG